MDNKNINDSKVRTKDVIKKICKERKIPIYKLEKKCGFANGYIGQLKKELPLERLLIVAKELGVSVNYLTTGAVSMDEFTSKSKKQKAIDFFTILDSYGYEVTELESNYFQIQCKKEGWKKKLSKSELETLEKSIGNYIDFTITNFFEQIPTFHDFEKPVAAHMYKEATQEEIEHDNDIMNDENLWNS